MDLVKGNVIAAGHLDAEHDAGEVGDVYPFAMLVQFASVQEFKAAQRAGRFEIEMFARAAVVEPLGGNDDDE